MAAKSVAKDQLAQAVCEQVSGSQTTTGNSPVVVDGSAMDIRGYSLVSYTFVVTTNSLDIGVYLANNADFSDEFLATSTGVLLTQAVGTGRWSGTVGSNWTPSTTSTSFSVPFGFVRLKIDPTVNDAHGTLAFSGLAKNA